MVTWRRDEGATVELGWGGAGGVGEEGLGSEMCASWVSHYEKNMCAFFRPMFCLRSLNVGLFIITLKVENFPKNDFPPSPRCS